MHELVPWNCLVLCFCIFWGRHKPIYVNVILLWWYVIIISYNEHKVMLFSLHTHICFPLSIAFDWIFCKIWNGFKHFDMKVFCDVPGCQNGTLGRKRSPNECAYSVSRKTKKSYESGVRPFVGVRDCKAKDHRAFWTCWTCQRSCCNSAEKPEAAVAVPSNKIPSFSHPKEGALIFTAVIVSATILEINKGG